jgi:hypothetical protein
MEVQGAGGRRRGLPGNSGFQAVQSTPLVDQDSRLLGMLSTH